MGIIRIPVPPSAHYRLEMTHREHVFRLRLATRFKTVTAWLPVSLLHADTVSTSSGWDGTMMTAATRFPKDGDDIYALELVPLIASCGFGSVIGKVDYTIIARSCGILWEVTRSCEARERSLRFLWMDKDVVKREGCTQGLEVSIRGDEIFVLTLVGHSLVWMPWCGP